MSEGINARKGYLNSMIEGYYDGFRDERSELPENHNFSPAYAHGRLNGRDDRICKPRDTAANLRRRADLILSGATT